MHRKNIGRGILLGLVIGLIYAAIIGFSVSNFVNSINQFTTTTEAAQASNVQLLPLVPSRVSFAESFPASIDIQLPYPVLDSDEVNPRFVNGVWHFNAFVVDRGDLNGGHGFYLVPGQTAARSVLNPDAVWKPAPNEAERLTNATAVGIGKICGARYDHEQAPDGYLYAWCIPVQRGNILRIVRIPPPVIRGE